MVTTMLQIQKKTRYRFSWLVNELKTTQCSRLRQALLRVISSVTDCSPNATDRIHIRNEFIGRFSSVSPRYIYFTSFLTRI